MAGRIAFLNAKVARRHRIGRRGSKALIHSWSTGFGSWRIMRSTADFTNTFGSHRAKFHGLIVIGKDMALSKQEEDRLRWRLDRTVIDSNAVSSVSFNELRDSMDHWLTAFHKV